MMQNILILKQKGMSTLGIVLGMITIVIFGYVFLPNIVNPQKRNIHQVEVDLQRIQQALNSYRIDNGFYPSDDQGLSALATEPSIAPIPQNWNGYIKAVPSDPWGNAYQYENINGLVRLWSYGPNGKKGDASSIITLDHVLKS